jgi:hypothetical protein
MTVEPLRFDISASHLPRGSTVGMTERANGIGKMLRSGPAPVGQYNMKISVLVCIAMADNIEYY